MKLSFKEKNQNTTLCDFSPETLKDSLSNNTKTELKHYEVTWDRHAEFRHYSE